MIFNTKAALAIALSASQFLGVRAEAQNQDALLKRALAELGAGIQADASILGASADAYIGGEGAILGDHLAEAAASAGIDGEIPGVAAAGWHKAADASILKRSESTGSEEVEVFRRYLTEAGFDVGSENIADQIIEVVKKNDRESEVMKRQLASAFGENVANKIVGPAMKREIPSFASNNKASVVKRAIAEAGIGASGEAGLLGASFAPYAGIEGAIGGDHLAEAAASYGAEASLPLGLASAGYHEDANASILKRALAELGAGIHADASILGASADAYIGGEGSILGDHLAEATASAGIDGEIPGVAAAGWHKAADASILKRAIAEAGIGASGEAGLLGASFAPYAGIEGAIGGDHLAEATASLGADASLPLGLASAGYHEDAYASILKRALAELGAGIQADASILGASADAYIGGEGAILGDHLAEAAASAGIDGEIPGVAAAGWHKAVDASILKRAVAEAGIGASGEAGLLGASFAPYAGIEGAIGGDHLAEAAASYGAEASLPLGLASAGYHEDANASILKRALAELGAGIQADASILGASADAYIGGEGSILGDHLAEAAASAGIDGEIPGVAAAGWHKAADASILKRALAEIGAGIQADASILGASADAYIGGEGSILGDHLAEAAASAGIDGEIPGVAAAGWHKAADASILKRALAEGGIGASGAAGLLGASFAPYAGIEGAVGGDHLAEAAASYGAEASLPLGLASAGYHEDAAASIL